MSPTCGEFHQAFLALGQRLVGVALLGEAGLRPFAALAEHRIDIAAEQRGDIDLHLLSRFKSASLTTSPLIGPALYFGNMIAASGQTREQAGQLVLQLSLFCTWMLLSVIHAIDAEEAEAQALHAIGAAIVIDDRKPRLPFAASWRNGFPRG